MNHSQNSKTKRQKDREMVYQLEGRPGLSTAKGSGASARTCNVYFQPCAHTYHCQRLWTVRS